MVKTLRFPSSCLGFSKPAKIFNRRHEDAAPAFALSSFWMSVGVWTPGRSLGALAK